MDVGPHKNKIDACTQPPPFKGTRTPITDLISRPKTPKVNTAEKDLSTNPRSPKVANPTSPRVPKAKIGDTLTKNLKSLPLV